MHIRAQHECKTCKEHEKRSCSLCGWSHDERYCDEACNLQHVRYEAMFKKCPECGKEWAE